MKFIYMSYQLPEPIAVDDSVDNQIRNQIEGLHKASADVAKNYKA